MKKINIILTLAGVILTVSALSSCSEFLQKPDTTGTVDLEAVYSTAKNAQSALLRCYRDVLNQDWPGGMGIGHSTYGAISAEVGRGYSWHGSYNIVQQGFTVSGTDGSDAGSENYSANWKYIRECCVVRENIDKVPDMDDNTKATIKAEATALIAFRYMGMFYRWGGVPIVRGSLSSSDDLSAPRATLQEVVDYIIELCDEAYTSLPDKWDNANTGRMTKGAVLAIKARTLLFAARPLFNSSKPYLDNGENNALICFGNEEPSRWQDAINAYEKVLSWASANGIALINTGGAGADKPNPNAFDDYGTATSVPSNKEIILAYKDNWSDPYSEHSLFNFINCSPNWSKNRYDTDCSGVLTNHIVNYYAADGTEMDWPKIGEASPRPGSDYRANVAKLEARAKADIKWGGFDAQNNPGVYYWQNAGWNRGGYSADKDKATVFPNAIDPDKGCGERSKFYYKAGTRIWFEPPIFRMAEVYMGLAEAYNEAGNSTKALENLNMVHNRAGLPSIKETDKDRLREIIQREDAIEFFQENHKFFDMRHWKRADIASGSLAGTMHMLQFNISNTDEATWPYDASYVETYWDAECYSAFWSDAMYLQPFPQTEINKGTTSQNPGY